MTRKLLLIENDPDEMLLYVSFLEGLDITVIEANCGNAALEKLDEHNDLKLVLIDIRLPDMSGVDILQTIRDNPDKYGDPRVVMFTNLTDEDVISKCIQLGAAGYFVKADTTAEEFKDIVEINSDDIEQN